MLSATLKLPSGYVIPRVGFGVYQNSDAVPAVLEAFKAGYRHIDSAQAYHNEAQVGKAFRQSGLKREDVYITSKINSPDHGYVRTLKGVDASLEEFSFDYLDLYLIHSPLSGRDLRLATYKALVEAKAAGKLKSIGVSNYGIKHIEEIRDAGYELPSVNQIELHPFCQQRQIVKYCVANNIAVEAYCPIMRGQRFDHPILVKISKKHDKDIAQILIRWSLQRDYIPLPKSATPSRIQSNFQVFDWELDVADMDELNGLDLGKDGAVSWNPVDAP
ncbi:Aldo/keto reductase [Cylindrobasidium torrendii FP15055 ss-10]|uniref:Aldo/keto reductase n=1 Tax=Cylindrobasidium torrendii FP15055 ss-10 TaxID=1314674 RepID=A0A0D7BX88_9AGAR|nr:Aldo/keto reductase [Cylindrobasidium torrendii FP15055 ss-10]